MVVVPTLPEGNQREDKAIFAVIRCFKPSSPDDMSGGVYHEGSVIKQGCADAESPGKELKRGCAELRRVRLKKPTGEKEQSNQANGTDQMISIEPPKFRELHEILYQVVSRFDVVGA